MHTGTEPTTTDQIQNSGSVKWRSPSNIALVKYWGKHGIQLPSNPSISFTLSEAHTITEVRYEPQEDGTPVLRFYFEGKEQPAFARRIEKYLETVQNMYPVLRDCQFSIYSENSFPHSTGIASSASAMSALALCMTTVANKLGYGGNTDYQQVSELARLGSGSASRSVYGPVAAWGATPAIPASSDRYAVPVTQVHEVFDGMCDAILIVDRGKKAVSSSAGHALMHGHPFAERRFEQAHSNLAEMTEVLAAGDLEKFIDITETEALSLHAMMMTSSPSYVLMKPGTLQIIERIRAIRDNEKLPVCFTLDAGPNVHLLYPRKVEEKVRSWINQELVTFCADGQVIHDYAGSGPVNLGE